MSLSVWWIGEGTSRVISSADWLANGITADTVTWSAANGWSIPHSVFSLDQLNILGADSEFLMGQDGPRLSRPPSNVAGYSESAYIYYRRIKDFHDDLITDNSASVHKTGAETVAGVKTFTSAPVVPNASFTGPKVSMTGNKSAKTFVKVAADGTFVAEEIPKALLQITDNCFVCSVGTAVTPGSSATYRYTYNVGISASDLRLVFHNVFSQPNSASPELDPATSVTFTAGIEDAAGVIFPVTFGGVRSVTLPGGGRVVSDPVAIEVTQGQVIAVRTFIPNTGTFYNNRNSNAGLPNSGGFTVSATDLTVLGSAAISDGSTFGWGPTAILGIPNGSAKAFVIQGDSISMGLQDGGGIGCYTPNPNLAGGGYLMRALSGQAGVVQMGLSGDRMQYYLVNTGHFRRAAYIGYARYAVIQYGINDLTGGRTAATLQADLLTQANRNAARGIVKTIITTITPHSSSTDRWTTTLNQTTSTENAARVTHNTWIRDGGPINAITFAPVATGTVGALRFGDVGHPIAGFVDSASFVESSLNSGLWKIPNRVVSDGAATASSTAITSATANFTAADLGRDILIAGAGAAGVDYYSTIVTVTNSTTIQIPAATFTTLPSTTVSGQQLLIGLSTKDGLHPCRTGNDLIAAGIKTPLLAYAA
jgi:lysophospholipase L1-like esterase